MTIVFYHTLTSIGNGIPLEAESNRKSFKPLFLDVGLMSAALGVNPVVVRLVGDLLPLFNLVIPRSLLRGR